MNPDGKAPRHPSVLALLALLVVAGVSLLATTASADAGKVKRVDDPKKVCMVNNKLFDKDQVPVEVDGKTYYGCCEMCKQALKTKPEMRTAVDPVSKKQVDKATAVIGAQPDGSVLYFESEANLQKFASTEPK
jgi:YHS domain-containing protein